MKRSFDSDVKLSTEDIQLSEGCSIAIPLTNADYYNIKTENVR